MSHTMARTNRERKFPGFLFSGHFTLGSESSRERMGQGPIGRFAPWSELALEQKGCESFSLPYCNFFPMHCEVAHTFLSEGESMGHCESSIRGLGQSPNRQLFLTQNVLLSLPVNTSLQYFWMNHAFSNEYIKQVNRSNCRGNPLNWGDLVGL